ncbi:MAG: purine-nucleoside phosphorylase, partial [Anaerolineales bacterium]|nr:purine-nucleoside phosphorylase [Anaerolineales bacterium]
MDKYFTVEEIDSLAHLIRKRIPSQPKVAMILGSGLGSLAEAVENPTVIPYGELPGWPVSTVIGHEGSLVIGTLEEQDVIVMQGRVHYYEGYSMNHVT